MKKWKFAILIFAICLTIAGCGAKEDAKEVKTFTAFIGVPGKVLPQSNRMMNRIAEKIGAKAEIMWMDSQTVEERVRVMIAGENYPDFIDGSDGVGLLIEAGALLPLDSYIEQYSNVKNYLTEEQWNQQRYKDGHIYVIPQFVVINGESMNTKHSGEAFWIQKRVLKWADYPKIKTLDEYFDLIEAYLEENPQSEDGKENIGFEILCDDWRYFCLENPPQFLAGYPNDGCAIVDPKTKKAFVYDNIPEAKKYFKKLCEEYNKGILDGEAFTISYEQYQSKIASGQVLGMVDQYWQFMGAEEVLIEQGMDDRTYVPLGLVLDESTIGAYRTLEGINNGKGIGISVSCEDVEGAMQFINDLLEPEIEVMRNWGEEGKDYLVDENGTFYRTEEQRKRSMEWYDENFCSYSYFPHIEGMLKDGINAVDPEQQPLEYYATLTEQDKEILDAYGYEKWTDFVGPLIENPPWFPLHSAMNAWPSNADYSIAKKNMAEVKHAWLPQVIMAKEEEFDQMWEKYMKTYENTVNVEAYEKELSAEVQRRIAIAEGEN